MRTRTMGRLLTAALVGTAGLGLIAPPTAMAKPPTRISDTFTVAICEASTADGDGVTYAVYDSLEQGTSAVAQVAVGNRSFRGYGDSTWTDSTVRSSVDVLDDGGALVGTATLSFSYSLADDATREVNKFKDGNIRVVEDHTITSLVLSDVSGTWQGDPLTGFRCEGSQDVGSLFFTNPASYVVRGSNLIVDSCELENAQGLSFEGNLDSMAVVFDYVDAPVTAFSPEITFTDGQWSGMFGLASDEGEYPDVAASATLTQNGKTYKLGGPYPGGFERFRITPYELVITADGPNAPATITCQLLDVQIAFHTVNPH